MRNRSKLGMLLAAIACAGVVAPQAQADTVIDLFNEDDQSVTVTGGSAQQSNTASGGSYAGGFREIHVDLNGGSFLNMTVDASVDEVVFDLAHPTSADDPIFPDLANITWDGVGNAFGGAVDTGTTVALLGGAHHSFYVGTNNFDEANRKINIEVWDEFGVSANADLTLLAGVTDHYLSFANFGGFDFSNVTAIRMHLLTDDIEINEFSAVVPVPPAVGLGLLGMFIVGGIRRRKNKVQA